MDNTATEPRWAEQPARPIQLLTVPEVAAYLRVSQAKVWQLLARGKLDSVKIDNSRRIREDVLAAYQAGLPTDHPARPAEAVAG